MSIMLRLTAIHKIMFSLIFAIAAYGLLPTDNFMLRLSFGWNAFVLMLLSLHWFSFFWITPETIRSEAREQDEKGPVIFLFCLAATLGSLLAVILLLLGKNNGDHGVTFKLANAIIGLFLSWSLVHTLFTIRYAHVYYADDKDDVTQHAGGLVFPEQEQPDLLDFAYFSFVIGMTFQVSDVTTNRSSMRRLVLLQSLLAFLFNTIIVALTVNVIAGLSG